jgi:transcription elongation factor Elf1
VNDQSHLDLKYFIDEKIYNCPYCNRRHVSYVNLGCRDFDWSTEKEAYAWFIRCKSCGKTSMHLTYENIRHPLSLNEFSEEIDIDSTIFYSVPTSFFVMDPRVPRTLRELITEAEGCLKMNYLTGASACCRKAIYELTVIEKAQGEDYETRIKDLKTKFPSVDPSLFDVLCHIKDMTSEKIHEQSWDEWDAQHLKLFAETLRAILHEIYVVPDERRSRSSSVLKLLDWVRSKGKDIDKSE